MKNPVYQQEILCKAMFAAQKAFDMSVAKQGMSEYFDIDMTGYCYDNRGNMTYKISMEAQDGIEDDYGDFDNSDGEFEDND